MKNKTIGGVYYELKESEYNIKIKNITFYFSSNLYLDKFKRYYEESVLEAEKRFNFTMKTKIDCYDFFLIQFYSKVEKRGFFIKIENEEFEKIPKYKMEVIE